MTVTISNYKYHQSLHYRVVDRDQSYCSTEREYLGTLMPIACKNDVSYIFDFPKCIILPSNNVITENYKTHNKEYEKCIHHEKLPRDIKLWSKKMNFKIKTKINIERK